MTLSLRLLACNAILVVAACSDDKDTTPTDATSAATVQTVDCATATPAMSVTTAGMAYSPNAATIAVNAVVKFTMPTAHNVESTTAGFAVDYGATKCLKFTAAGTFMYKCTAHGFTGTVTVQ